MIDLHAHTTASDGSFSPSELVAHAKEIGLSAVAITDHDTFGGWNEALEAGEKYGVEVVPGIELSVDGELGKFHLLGFYCEPDSALGRAVVELQISRATRNDQIIEILREKYGFDTSMEKVRALAGDHAVIGRPHIAQSILGQNGIESIQQAFDELLANKDAVYVPKDVLDPIEAVQLIHDANGVAIWAHPLFPPSERADRLNAETVRPILERWTGLDGFETFYGAYTPEEGDWMADLCRELDMVESGGSDFHGATKPKVELGKVNGGSFVPDSIFEKLKAKARRS